MGYILLYFEYNKQIDLKIHLKKNYSPSSNFKIINETSDIPLIENQNKNTGVKILETEIDDQLKKIVINILKGDTFVSILKEHNLNDKEIFKITQEIEKIFDLRQLQSGQNIILFKNSIDQIKKIQINQNLDTIISIFIEDNILVERKILKKIPYQESKEFYIQKSLYTDGIENNLPENILIKLIKLFSFDLDFQRDIKKNTLVSVSYDLYEIFENNKIVYKDINYALISINNKKFEYFKFVTEDGNTDYFNREGKNVKKSILKTPIDGARLSSSFGMRKHPISGFNKMHKGVDFAAPTGTPIYAGGNGIIEYIGRNGGYGNYIRIRHNNEYKTAYAHLSSFKKGIAKGSRVNQGEVIGFVGSTGKSTGPHLHYEIIFQNKQINPMKLKLPSGRTLKGQELENFKKSLNQIYANHLNLLFE